MEEWIDLGLARNLLFVRLLEDEEAILEQVPKEFDFLDPLRLPIAKVGVRFTQNKYPGPENEASALEARLDRPLRDPARRSEVRARRVRLR